MTDEEIYQDHIRDNFCQPDYVKIDVLEWQKIQEENQYFRTTIRSIKEELDEKYTYTEKNIKEKIEELEHELREEI